MVEERAEVEPGVALLEDPEDGLDDLDYVVNKVDEEAGDDTVVAGDILRGGVHNCTLDKLNLLNHSTHNFERHC